MTFLDRTYHRRRMMSSTSALTEYEADLTSKDRMKQKEAIKRILVNKIRDDWRWPDIDSDFSIPNTPVLLSENLQEETGDWTERDEWESNTSESGTETIMLGAGGENLNTSSSNWISTTAQDSKSGVVPGDFTVFGHAETVKVKNCPEHHECGSDGALPRKLRRRQRILKEMTWNEGLRCFVHRRNAWTGARHIIQRTADPNGATRLDVSRSSTEQIDTHTAQDLANLTLQIPMAPPILPPETPLRQGITEKAYNTIYDKVIVQSQTPYCPVNLSVIVQSCVTGWKRDGEWPPKSTVGDTVPSMKASMSTEPVSARGKNKGVIRRSFNKVKGVVGSKVKPDE